MWPAFSNFAKTGSTVSAVTLRKSVEKRVTVVSTPEVLKAYELASRVVDHYAGARTGAAMTAMDGLLGHLVAFFDGHVSYGEIGSAVPHMVASPPRPIGPAAFPIAMMSELLNVHRVRLDMRNMPNWQAFIGRYGGALMGA